MFDNACVVPYEFVRLRYFFGQRLGVLELTDQQAYGMAKQRFHNVRLHGAGVLCGLKADRYLPTGSATTTLLRVSNGAALDGCGREMVVPWDACVDVAAFVRTARPTNPDLSDPTAAAAAMLWVAICYRECPSDPAPAPTDACGCEPTGCENSRIREGFELKLLTVSQLPAAAPTPADPSAPCPLPPADPCQILACVDLKYDNDGAVIDLGPPVNDPVQRVDLWSSSAIQSALTAGLDTAALDLRPGPRFGPLGFTGTGPTSGKILLPVSLALGQDGKPSELLGDPIAGVTFALRLFQDDNWNPTPETPTRKPFWNSTDGRYELAYDTLAPGRYRLTAAISTETPVVDAEFRTLGPPTLHRWVPLIAGPGDVLTLSTTTP
jgi:hypothetical protein